MVSIKWSPDPQSKVPHVTQAKTLTVEIVVPAFNEEACIGDILRDLTEVQDDEWFSISRINVISDASTDRTDAIVVQAAERDLRIHFTRKPNRAGKSDSVNLALAMTEADIVIFLDADVRLGSPECIPELLSPFRSGNVAMVQGNLVRSQRRITKTLSKQAAQFDSILAAKARARKPVSWWTIDGRVIALARDFYERMVLPRDMPEDQFLFYSCQQLGKRAVWASRAHFLYGPPETFAEYRHQWSRYLFYTRKSRQRFGSSIMDGEMGLPGLWKMILASVVNNPVAGLAWIACFAASNVEFILRVNFNEYEQGLYRTESRPV